MITTGADVSARHAERERTSIITGLRMAAPPAENDRARKVAAIHALADWLALHPDLPMPETVTAYAYVRPADEIDQELRDTGVRQAAARVGEQPYGERQQQFSHALLRTTDHGIAVVYVCRSVGDHESWV